MRIYTAFFIFLLALAGCDKKGSDTPSSKLLSVETNSVTEITDIEATCGGYVKPCEGLSVTSRGVVWSTEKSPSLSLETKTADGGGTGAFISSIAGLRPNTTYYVRAYATTAQDTCYGEEKVFSTAENEMAVKTAAISSVTDTSAVCGGTVTVTGSSSVILSRGVVWSTSASPSAGLDTKSVDGKGAGAFTSRITRLSPGTQYYVRAYAITSADTIYGKDSSFFTVSVTTGEVTDVSSSGAKCGGTVGGSATVTARGLVWNTSQNPTLESCIGRTSDGSGTGTFSGSLTNLSPTTAYYVRAYAVTFEGQAIYGDEKWFMTGERIDLSVGGTANCYVVSGRGHYLFNGTVKGCGTGSVGSPVDAEVLWESFGTDVKPQTGDVVDSVSYSGGNVYFTAGQDGNAVIAVKDGGGNILWSWHIWVCAGYDPMTSAQTYYNSTAKMMDRNLGATSATPGDVRSLGLLYQWGRKDPFPGSSSISESTVAATTGNWPSPTMSTSETGTISYVTANPMQIVTANDRNYDWYYTGDYYTESTRWQTTKTEYDPCPPGWRVPDGGEDGVWSKAFGSSVTFSGGPWIESSRGMNFGTGAGKEHCLGENTDIWYPATGYFFCTSGVINSVGIDGGCWSCTPIDIGVDAYLFYFFQGSGNVAPSNVDHRSYGQSVRCVRQID